MFAPSGIGSTLQLPGGGIWEVLWRKPAFFQRNQSGDQARHETGHCLDIIYNVLFLLFLIVAVAMKLLSCATPSAKRFDLSVAGKTKAPSLLDNHHQRVYTLHAAHYMVLDTACQRT